MYAAFSPFLENEIFIDTCANTGRSHSDPPRARFCPALARPFPSTSSTGKDGLNGMVPETVPKWYDKSATGRFSRCDVDLSPLRTRARTRWKCRPSCRLRHRCYFRFYCCSPPSRREYVKNLPLRRRRTYRAYGNVREVRVAWLRLSVSQCAAAVVGRIATSVAFIAVAAAAVVGHVVAMTVASRRLASSCRWWNLCTDRIATPCCGGRTSAID